MQQTILRNKGEQNSKANIYSGRKNENRSGYRIVKPMAFNTTKVLVLNSSPNMDRGNTATILHPFITGMRGAGADVEIIHIYKLNIYSCNGDFNCWISTPGICDQDDDMQILYPKIKNADIIVLATPIYCEMVNSRLKNVIDRLVVLTEPFTISVFSGRTIHPLRKGVNPAKVVLVSTCGDWEMENFYLTVEYIKAFCNHMSYEYGGAILRPHAGAMSLMTDSIEDILDAARKAGEELIANEEMDQFNLDIISGELMSRDEYIEAAKCYFEDEIARNENIY